MTTRAVVLLSGGLDSATTLAIARAEGYECHALSFDYGQRHGVELECRQTVRSEIARVFSAWGSRLGPDRVLDIASFGAIADTALTSEAEIVMLESGLPSTFVPGRNLVFFTYAAALGYRRGLHTLIGGMCETDYSGYPDCRDATLRALGEAIRLGTEIPFTIETPLMWLSKAETWELAERLGGQALIDLMIEHTHTCYRGERGKRHDWGYGCGTCPACELRARGYEQWQAARAENRRRQSG